MTLTPTSNLKRRLLGAIAVLGLAALAGLAGASVGHTWGYRTAKAEGDAALAKLQATRAEARAAVAFSVPIDHAKMATPPRPSTTPTIGQRRPPTSSAVRAA